MTLPSVTNKEKDRCAPSSSSSFKKSRSSTETTTLVDIGGEDDDGSDSGGSGVNKKPGMADWLRKLDLERQIAEIDADVLGIKDTIENLNAQLTVKEVQREELVMILNKIRNRISSGMTSTTTTTNTTMQRADGIDRFKGIDYMDGEFDWMGGLKARMRSVFGISEFRLCQRGYVLCVDLSTVMHLLKKKIQNLQCQYGRQGYCSRDAYRWWQITHVPASSPSHTWLYTRYFTLDIPYHRPDFTSPKPWK